jgi:AraC-like DNA-binding protein
MENQIKQLREEVAEYRSELQKLKNELSAAKAITPQPKSDRPTDISAAFRSAAVATAEKVADVLGVEESIAVLTTQMNQRQQQLEELQKQYQKQLRLGRVEEARQKIREQIQRIDDIAFQAESAYLNLKTLYKEVEGDFKSLSQNPPGSLAARLENLVNFNFLQVPTLVEQNNSFTLIGRQIDLFKPERDAEQRAQAQSARESKEALDAMILASQQRKIVEKQQYERERIQELLSVKTIELHEAEARRALDMEQIARGVRLNISALIDFIKLTNVEIQQLQKDLDAVYDTI